MEKTVSSDSELLAGWLGHRREAAFHALVARYAGLVQATARRTCGDDLMAAEAAQLTFITLARKAGTLASCASLGGWLHITALMHAKNLLRKSRREERKRQQLQTAMDNDTPGSSTASWRELQPLLDDALAALSEKDREALLMRYYRSLGIREIAATLGIATEAAQKRIERATERLRGKLARRGFPSGGSLSAAMAAGFAADSQAALPAVSLLASEAIAAGAAGGGAASSSLFSAVFMKTTSAILPLSVLVVASAWIASQFESIAGLEQQNLRDQQLLAMKPLAVESGRRTASVRTLLDAKPVDWEEVARQLQVQDRGGYLGTKLRLEEGFLSMDRATLIASLDEIEAATLSKKAQDTLEVRLGGLLVKEDPETFAKRFIGRLHDGDSSPMRTMLISALHGWVERDQMRALEWFDQQIAAGTFASKGSGHFIRMQFEGSLVRLLISQDPDAASGRLATLPAAQRMEVFRVGRLNLTESEQPAFVKVIREQLPEADHLSAVTWPVSDLGDGGIMTYPKFETYLDGCQATPAERDACILAVANRAMIPRKAGRFVDATAEDVATWRAWVGKRSPALLERATGKAIEGLLREMKFPAVAAIALDCKAGGAGDEVLLPLLSGNVEEHQDLAREIASKLTDATRRAEALKQLGGQP